MPPLRKLGKYGTWATQLRLPQLGKVGSLPAQRVLVAASIIERWRLSPCEYGNGPVNAGRQLAISL